MNKTALIIGITGSYASGKSTVAEIFKSLGAYIIDADRLAREIVMPGEPAYNEIKTHFGSDIIQEDLTINRKKLGEIIFNDLANKTKLENITHPRIQELFYKKLNEAKSDSANKLIIYVVPLLFESKNKYPELEKIIVVSADKNTSIERITKREGCSRELAEKKYLSQMSIEEKEKKADFLIKNNSDMASLEASVEHIYRKLTSL